MRMMTFSRGSGYDGASLIAYRSVRILFTGRLGANTGTSATSRNDGGFGSLLTREAAAKKARAGAAFHLRDTPEAIVAPPNTPPAQGPGGYRRSRPAGPLVPSDPYSNAHRPGRDSALALGGLTGGSPVRSAGARAVGTFVIHQPRERLR